MRHAALVILPVAGFALVVVVARLSGNDKSPFLVLAVLALLALLCVLSVAVGLSSASLAPRAWALAAGSALPLTYTAVVLLLARRHWIDASHWLGFS